VTEDERAQVLVTARFLRAAAAMQWLAVGLTLLAAAALIHGRGIPAAVAALALGIVAISYAFRVSFDARLLEDIAGQRLTTSQLDQALGGLQKKEGGRSWDERCRGSRRLVMHLAIVTFAQAVAVVLIHWS
jgi:uncharacterized membrane protein YoaK (UPF0700 family)